MTIAPGDLIAVTGGTGAIGRRVVHDLLQQGFRIRLLSRSAPDNRQLEHVPLDLAARTPLPIEALAGCSAVVHLASHIPPRQEDPDSAEICLQTNALGTLKLLRAAEEAGIGRFVQTTSANAYAPGLDVPSEEDAMYPAERAPFYLSSKIVQDVFGSYWANRCGLAVTTFRLSSVYGAGMDRALFTRIARSLRAGEGITLANGGTFGADFVDISDVSSAFGLFLRQDLTGVFNIASGQRSTLLEAARILLELTGSADDLLTVEPEQRTEPGFPRMDISKARKAGFDPLGLREGLAKLVDWVDAQDGLTRSSH